MIRKLFIAFLILLAVGSAWMWIESVRSGRLVWHSREHVDGASFMVWAENGQIRLTHWWFFEDSMTGMKATRARLGFGYLVERLNTYQNRAIQIHRIWFPAWAPIVLFGGYPLWVLIAGIMRWRVRRKRHRCQECGYSLIGLVEPRCPECGLDVTIPVGATSDDYVEPVTRLKMGHLAVMSLILIIAVGGALLVVYRPATPSSQPSTIMATTKPFRKVFNLSNTIGGGRNTMPITLLDRSSFLEWRLFQKFGGVFRYGCVICGDLAKRRLSWGFDHETVDSQAADPFTALTNGSITAHWQCDECMKPTPGPSVDELYSSFHPQSPCAHCGYSSTDSDGKAKPWDGRICPDCGGWYEQEPGDQESKRPDP